MDRVRGVLTELNYTSVDQVRVVTEQRRLTEMAKFDFESAYRLIPEHPDDRLLLGMSSCITPVWAKVST